MRGATLILAVLACLFGGGGVMYVCERGAFPGCPPPEVDAVVNRIRSLRLEAGELRRKVSHLHATRRQHEESVERMRHFTEALRQAGEL
jgi:hypothetical protein